MKYLCRATLALAAFAFGAPAWATGTLANSTITNAASVSYTDPGNATITKQSNTVTLKVDELLNVVVADGGDEPVLTPDSDQPIAFTVTNTGNGTEAFELTAAVVGGGQITPTNLRIYIDNGDGVFTAADTLYVFNSNDPIIGPDLSQLVFVVSDIPPGQANGDIGTISLRASAVTASPLGDPAGTAYPGAGDGGTTAVVGNTTASAIDQANYVVSALNSTLVKTQSVLDPFGGSSSVPGSVVTYTLTFDLTGTGSITLGKITDAIPANTTYVSGSMVLNGGAALTDTDADADGARFVVAPAGANGRGFIEVNLTSPLPSPSTQTVTFKVTIN